MDSHIPLSSSSSNYNEEIGINENLQIDDNHSSEILYDFPIYTGFATSSSGWDFPLEEYRNSSNPLFNESTNGLDIVYNPSTFWTNSANNQTTNNNTNRSQEDWPKKDVASFDIFMDHFRCQGGVIIADDVIGSHCFRTWVDTRKGEIKKPCESFRKALTSHVMGSDGRKPFPEEYETALLQILRQHAVWPCFRDMEGVNIGKAGFRAHGYHESKSIQKAVPNMESSKRSKVILDTQKIINTWLQVPHSIRQVLQRFNVTNEKLFGPSSTVTENILDPNKVENAKMLFDDNLVNPQTLGAALARNLCHNVEPSQLLSFFYVANSISKFAILENDYFDLSLDALQDIRFQDSFLFPDGLCDDRITGHHHLCFETFVITKRDENARKIYEACNETEEIATYAYTNPVVLLKIGIAMLPRLVANGSVVFQVCSMMNDGKQHVIRSHYEMISPNEIVTAFQDVSDLYPQVVALPPIEDVIGVPLHKQSDRASTKST